MPERDESTRAVIDPWSIPPRVLDAAWAAFDAYNGRGEAPDDERDAAVLIAAALTALGCEWDDDQGKNTMRRLVGAWQEKP